MAGIDVFRKQINSSLFGQPVELRAHEGWVQWRAEGSTTDWENLFEIPLDGADGTHGLDGANGLDGAPGTDGASVELRVYGDWVQWRQDDDSPTWTNLYAIDEAGGVPITPEKTPIEAMILLAETVLAADGVYEVDLTTFDLTGLVDLEIYYEGYQTNASYVHMFFNNDLTAANYRAWRHNAGGSASSIPEAAVMVGNYGNAMRSTGRIYIPRFQSGLNKTADSVSTYRGSAAGNLEVYTNGMMWSGTAPINRITIRAYNHPTGQIKAGSAFRLYGRKQVEVVTDLDGGRMFRGEKGETGQPGINGRDVEMQTIPDGDACQIIQWRHAGDLTWADLAHVPVCGSGESIPPATKNNRCGAAVAVVNELRRIYNRIQEDPTLWDNLQGFAVDAGAVVDVSSAIAGTITGLLGFAGTAGRITLWGTRIAGVLSFLADILGLAKPDEDWTQTGEDWLIQTLYCVLSRRETTEIDLNVLREWSGFVNDTPSSVNTTMLRNILGVIPVDHWRDIGLFAQPNGVDCLATECNTRIGPWSYQIGDYASLPEIPFNSPIGRVVAWVDIGKTYQKSVEAVRTPLNTMVYQITFNFGRPINLTGLDVGVTYLQPVEATNNVVSVVGFGELEISGVTGSMPTTGTFRWRSPSYVQVSTLIISGKISIEDADTEGLEYLLLDYVRLCGVDYAPLGESVINSIEDCDPYNPCIDGIDYGTDHCYTWDFTSSDGGWAGGGVYEAGVGWKSYLNTAPAYLRQDVINISKGGTNVNGRTVRRVEVDAMVTYGAIGGYAAEKYFRLSDVANGTIYLDRIDSFNGLQFDETDRAGNPLRSGLRLSAVVSSRNDISAAAPNPRGYVTVRRISIWYDGPDAEFTGGTGT